MNDTDHHDRRQLWIKFACAAISGCANAIPIDRTAARKLADKAAVLADAMLAEQDRRDATSGGVE